MSEHTEQTERAFQKQPNITAKHGRWTKNVGLGFKTPKEASQGHYIDKKCPFVGDVQIRGRILKGIVKSAKMKRTVIIRPPSMGDGPRTLVLVSKPPRRHHRVTTLTRNAPSLATSRSVAVSSRASSSPPR